MLIPMKTNDKPFPFTCFSFQQSESAHGFLHSKANTPFSFNKKKLKKNVPTQNTTVHPKISNQHQMKMKTRCVSFIPSNHRSSPEKKNRESTFQSPSSFLIRIKITFQRKLSKSMLFHSTQAKTTYKHSAALRNKITIAKEK